MKVYIWLLVRWQGLRERMSARRWFLLGAVAFLIAGQAGVWLGVQRWDWS
jgi:hypothetical protein